MLVSRAKVPQEGKAIVNRTSTLNDALLPNW